MANILDALYALGLTTVSPWLAWRSFKRGRDGYRRLLAGHGCPARQPSDQAPLVWFHGVSLGEINLLVPLIKAFRLKYPNWRIGVTATTPAGLQEARKKFEPDCLVTCFCWDFTWQVKRIFQAWKPALVVLAESQLWPNWLSIAGKKQVPVVVVNGRMSPKSAASWTRRKWLAGKIFPKVHSWLVQDQTMGGVLAELGVDRSAISVTGSMKFDGAKGDKNSPLLAKLKSFFPFSPGTPVWVAGSTQETEVSLILDAYTRLQGLAPDLRLVLVPRQPDSFASAARLLEDRGIPFLRRSSGTTIPPNKTPKVLLLDTTGELSAAWGLGTMAFVGGSLDGKRGGQNPIEPASYGLPVCFGPHVWNFRDITAQLIAAGGAKLVGTDGKPADSLVHCLKGWLSDPAAATEMGEAGRVFVARQQGATDRTLDFLAERGLLDSEKATRQAG